MKQSSRISGWVRKTVQGLSPYASARSEFSETGESVVLLDANESPFENGINRYPDPLQRQLKELLAAQMGVDPGQMLLGNGSDEVLDLVFRVFCEPNTDAVITLPPTFGMFKVLAGINAIANIEVPLDPDFQPDVPAILEASGPRTKVLFLCSPNNPTGNVAEPDRVRQLLDAFPGLVVVDEAYIQFASGPGLESWLEQYDNLIITRTLSKAYGMAGIRLGMCLAHPEVIGYMNRIKLPYNVNELTQRRALEALRDKAQFQHNVEVILSERNRLAAYFERCPMVEKVFPSEANFLLVRVDDASLRYRQLVDAGIVVRNRSGQLRCENTLRITVGTPEENNRLMVVVDRLKSIENEKA